jgi:DNA-binding NarL/FixJ family response regulator
VIRVLIAEDHQVVRFGLVELLGSEDDVEVVAAVGDGESAVSAVAEHRPDVILLDISMPEQTGIEATGRILAAWPEARVVMLTASAARDQIVQAIDAGALGYLLKDSSPDELIEGVRAAARGEAPLDPKAARELLADRQETRGPELTGREREVLELVAEGLPNKRIATRLEISEKTVKAHLPRVYERIGVSDRTQAALWARERGIGRDRAGGPGGPGTAG